MITLTTPAQINSVLGGNVPVGYDKLVLSPFTMDARVQTLRGTLRLTSTSAPDMQPIDGSLSIDATTGILEVSVPQLDFYRKVRLSGAPNQSVQTLITDAQASIENGLISLGVISGVRSAGV